MTLKYQIADLKSMLLAVCAMLLAPCSLRAGLSIDNLAATNVQPTSAFFCGNLTATNGATNAISLRLCYGTADGLTNLTWWGYTNHLLSVATTGAFSTNVTGLTPTTHYYYRWYALQGTNTAWSTPSTNFWTTARNPNPTNPPPAVSAYPVMTDTNGNLVSPTNFFPKNGIGTTSQISNLQAQITSNDVDISVLDTGKVSQASFSNHTSATGTNVHGLGTAATSNADAFATAAQGGKADSAVQPDVAAAGLSSRYHYRDTGYPYAYFTWGSSGGSPGWIYDSDEAWFYMPCGYTGWDAQTLRVYFTAVSSDVIWDFAVNAGYHGILTNCVWHGEKIGWERITTNELTGDIPIGGVASLIYGRKTVGPGTNRWYELPNYLEDPPVAPAELYARTGGGSWESIQERIRRSTFVTAPASNSASGAGGWIATGITDGTNYLYLYDPNGGGTGTGRWVRAEGSVTW